MSGLDREKLKATRKQLKLTQEKLAERAGISDRTIRYIENEEIDPRSATLQRMCESLNLSVDSVLIGQNGDEKECLGR